MPRSNDLKIELSEIFGGEASESLETDETDLPSSAGKAPSIHIPTAEEFDEQFVVEEDVERNPHFQESLFTVEEILASPARGPQETPLSPILEAPVETPFVEVGGGEASKEDVASAEATLPFVIAESRSNAEVLPESPHEEAPPELLPVSDGEEREVTIDFGTFTARPFAGPSPLLGVKPKASLAPNPPVPIVLGRPPQGSVLGGPAMIEAADEPAPNAGVEAPSPETIPLEEEARLQRENEYLALYDQFRLVIHRELLDLVGDKKTKTMLSRTLEATRNKYPDYFRNANWDDDGNLLEDGSMDIRRLIHNKTLFEPGKADALQDLALKALLEMRLLAVEKGMGASMRTKLHLKMRQWSLSKRDHETASGNEPVLFNRLLAMLG